MRKACVIQSRVNESYIAQSENGSLPDVPELGCYIKCMLDHGGLVNDDGSIYLDNILHLLTEDMKETAEMVTQECGTIR